MPEDDPYAGPDAALSDAQAAYLAALKADPDPQRALTKARSRAAQARDFAKSLTRHVGERALEIRDRERLSLSALAKRFGVSTPRAQQWVDEGRQADEQREDADG